MTLTVLYSDVAVSKIKSLANNRTLKNVKVGRSSTPYEATWTVTVRGLVAFHKVSWLDARTKARDSKLVTVHALIFLFRKGKWGTY